MLLERLETKELLTKKRNKLLPRKLRSFDTEIEIRSPYANLKAKVVPLPFYDPKKRIPIK